MKNQWIMANMPTNFGTKTMISEQASAFYEERAKGGVGAVVVDIEDIKNFDLESVQKLAEKLHVYDCQLWIACVLDTTTIDFVKNCGADGVQLEMEKTEQTVLEMLKNNIQIPILLHTEKCMDKAVYQYIENFVYGVVMKGSIEDCAKLKKDTEDTDLMVIWECDVITKQEAMQALENKQCDAIASQKMFLVAPDFVQRWEQEQPYNACCQCGVCTEAMQNKKPIHCPYCPETGREYLENQRRKIATRKEVIVTQCDAVGMYAAKKAAERGFLTTVFCQKNTKNQISQYEKYLMATIERLGVKIETEQSADTKYLLEKKPYLTVCQKNTKNQISQYEKYLMATIERLGVKIETEQSADTKYLLEKKPYLTVFVHSNVCRMPDLQDVEYTLAEDILQYNKTDMKQFKNAHILLLGGNQQAVDAAMYLRKYTDGKIYMVEQKHLEYNKTDMKQFKNAHILLLGGNQQAVDAAMYLRKYTDGKIYMVEQKHLEETDITNSDILEDLDKQNIQIVYGADIEEVQQDSVCLNIGQQRYDWSFCTIQEASANPVKIVVSGSKSCVHDDEAIMALMDERLSYAVVGENDEITESLEEVFELFSRFYLA